MEKFTMTINNYVEENENNAIGNLKVKKEGKKTMKLKE